MTLSQRRLKRVLERIMDVAEEDEDFLDFICDELDKSLDTYNGEDGFGTEGQNDPRGDFREGNWSMWLVQGVSGL